MTPQQRWNQRNRATLNEAQAWYRAKKKRAIPAWAYAERPRIKELYRKASELGMEVDHFVPLDDPDVCGLHCLSNLRLLDPETNKRRGTLYWRDLNPDAPVPF